MKSYNFTERAIAKSLDAFPGIKVFAKKVYQRLNYIAYKEKGFKYFLQNDVSMKDPIEWSNYEGKYSELFFGYYDKAPWSPDMEKALFHHILSKDEVEILLFSKKDQSVKSIGKTDTWNYQQGSMAQWVPNKNDVVVFNERINNELSSRFINLNTGEQKALPWPIQSLNPSRNEYISLNYKRLFKMREEYGYSGESVNFSENQSLESDGLWLVDMDKDNARLIINLKQLSEHQPREEMISATHKVNHVIYSPSGSKFVFMHRWFGPKGKFSRLYVSDNQGTQLKILLDDRMISHYHWRDDNHLIVWGRKEEIGDRYYLINTETGQMEIVGDGVLNPFGDGHPSFSPNGRWLITDTYPDKGRQRHLLLFDMQTGKVTTIGRFFAPWKFNDGFRCDLHPRWSPDGTWVSIDSAHTGMRQTYLLDISRIVKNI